MRAFLSIGTPGKSPGSGTPAPTLGAVKVGCSGVAGFDKVETVPANRRSSYNETSTIMVAESVPPQPLQGGRDRRRDRRGDHGHGHGRGPDLSM